MELKELLRLKVTVAPPVSAGDTPGGELRVIPFTGGTFEGDGVRGTILPGGTDWQVVRSDGVLEIRAHYLLETEEGERIEVISEGIRHAPPGVLDRIAARRIRPLGPVLLPHRDPPEDGVGAARPPEPRPLHLRGRAHRRRCGPHRLRRPLN